MLSTYLGNSFSFVKTNYLLVNLKTQHNPIYRYIFYLHRQKCYCHKSNSNSVSTKYLHLQKKVTWIPSYIFARNYNAYNKSYKKGSVFKDESILPKWSREEREKPTQDILFVDITKNKSLSDSQCDEMRNNILKTGVSDNVVDGFIMNICLKEKSFYAGKSYLKYMTSTNKILNLAIVGNFMKLCFFMRKSHVDESIGLIEMLYEDYISKYPVLDANSAENVLLGISLTKYWSEYQKYLDMIWASCSPGGRPYSAIVEAAFLNKKYEEGWKIANEAANHGKNLHDYVYELWLDIAENNRNDLYLETILNYFSECNIKPTTQVILKLKKTFGHLNKTNSAAITSVTTRGICRSCKRKLEEDNVSKEEFYQLKEAFLDPVLIGKDIFIKTRPEELTEYQEFLRKTAPYDVVLDGLNIAFSGSQRNRNPSNYCFMIKSVVDHFAQQSQKVLVLGRKHMKSWPKQDMDYIKNNSTLFLAEDLSHDDPFLLYAALFSGPHTNFVSRDLMRGHKFLLKDPILKNIFTRWQAQHQVFLIHINNFGKVILKWPSLYCQRAHKMSDGTWHVPYRLEDNQNFPGKQSTLKTNVEEQIGWLCLR